MNKRFKVIERIRKNSPSPQNYLRLHRAEFGDILRKNFKINNYYPDSTRLLNSLSKFYKIGNEHISVGLGAEAVIKDIFLTTYLKKKKIKILTTAPNFFMYKYYSKLFNFNFNEIEILDKKKILLSFGKMEKEIKKKKINFLILVNPSSPIEKKWSSKDLLKIVKLCERKKILLLLDQVYEQILKFSNLKLIKKFKNIIILGSFSKIFGLPGLRLGYCFSNKKTIKEINTCRLAIELPAETIEYSKFLLDNWKTQLKIKINKIYEARKFASNEFKKIGIGTLNKNINSVTFFCKNRKKKKKLIIFMKKKKILLNSLKTKYHDNLINITTTNKNNLKIFFSQLKKFLNK